MDKQPTDVPQPVAYDSEGRPLYAAPPQAQYVHISRPIEPEKQPIPEDIKVRHDQSVRDFPFLNLSEAEYVISAVRRHPIGMLMPAGLTVFLVALAASLMINYTLITDYFGIMEPPSAGLIYLIGFLFMILVSVGGYISIWVYMNNKFFLTNESVIQEIQTGLFARHEQTVSLINIEDASFQEQGILQTMLDYGSIRLSTEGDETTYRFEYVASPKEQIATLNNAIEAFKNGRPILND